MAEEGGIREVHHHHDGWCCVPRGRGGALFCGLTLVVVGVVLLLSSLDLVPWDLWEIVGPGLLIAWGLLIAFGRSRGGDR